MYPKSPSARGFVVCFIRLLFKSTKYNALFRVKSIQFICRIAAMTKTGKMHGVIWIETICEQVKTRRNLAHWGSSDTVNMDTCNVADKCQYATVIVLMTFFAFLLFHVGKVIHNCVRNFCNIYTCILTSKEG